MPPTIGAPIAATPLAVEALGLARSVRFLPEPLLLLSPPPPPPQAARTAAMIADGDLGHSLFVIFHLFPHQWFIECECPLGGGQFLTCKWTVVWVCLQSSNLSFRVMKLVVTFEVSQQTTLLIGLLAFP